MGDLSGSSGLRKKVIIAIAIEPIEQKVPVFRIAFYRVKHVGELKPGEYALKRKSIL